MKKSTIIFSIAAILFAAAGCDKKGIDDDLSFLNTAKTSNNNKIFDISNDNSGTVKITPTGQGAASYTVKFGHGTGTGASAVVMPGNYTTHVYPEGNYTVTIVSKSISGVDSTNTYPLVVTYRAPENLDLGVSQTVQYLKVTPNALYAVSYLVYFGDVANETGTPIAKGGSAAHTYATAGDYNVRLVAQSAGAAKAEKITKVTVTPTFGTPITFEDASTNYFFGTFGDNQHFDKVANPNPSGLNTSATVGMFTRGNQSWSGTYSPVNAIDMAVGKKIRVLAYNPDPAMIGKSLNVELESSSSIPNGVAVLRTAFTTSGAWEELVFDFGSVAGVPADAKFSQLVLRFNDSADGAGAVIYVDNFRLTN